MVGSKGQETLMPFFSDLCLAFLHSLQDQEENKGATSWPEFYIDQLNSMAAVSISAVL